MYFNGMFDEWFSEKSTHSKPTKDEFIHPNSEQNISKIYTFARTISIIALKPTKRDTFAIIDNNGYIIEEIDDILEAKLRYIQIVLGE